MTYKRPTEIFRLMHYESLEFTLNNGLHSCNSPNCDPNYYNIGHRNLIEKRGNKIVPLNPGGVLNDYIPFYFAIRSPMLFSIKSGSVDGYKGTQEEIIYLVSSVQKILKESIPFVFTDGHAYEIISKFYNNENDLVNVDWSIMDKTYWNNTPSDNDRRRRRMAEFLAYKFIPIKCIFKIVVFDQSVAIKINQIQHKCKSSIKVFVNPNWYY